MSTLRIALCTLGALLLTPTVAYAHLVTTGLGPFYDGVTHLALSPDDLLGLLAVALLAGLRGERAGRWAIFVLPASWLAGGIAGLNWPGFPELPGLSILSFAVAGALVAVDPKLPDWSVAGLAAILGLLHGLLNGAALSRIDAGFLTLMGISITVFILALLSSALVVSLRRPWTRIAVRVAGSWVAAVGMLMFGWLYQGRV
jgi:hydrogenase/urease accessory protein HupE